MVQTAWRSCKWPITENNEVQDGCGTEYLETPNLWTGKFPNKKKKKTKHLLYFKVVVSLVIFVYKHWSKYCLEIKMILKFTDWAKTEKLLVILSAHCRNTSIPKAGLTDLERPPFWQGKCENPVFKHEFRTHNIKIQRSQTVTSWCPKFWELF